MVLCTQSCTLDFLIKEPDILWRSCLSFTLMIQLGEFHAYLSCGSGQDANGVQMVISFVSFKFDSLKSLLYLLLQK